MALFQEGDFSKVKYPALLVFRKEALLKGSSRSGGRDYLAHCLPFPQTSNPVF